MDNSDLSVFSGEVLYTRKLEPWGTIGRLIESDQPYRKELVHSRHVFVLWEAEARTGVADFVIDGRRMLRPGPVRGSVDFRPAGTEFTANVHESSLTQRTVLTIDELALAKSSAVYQPFSDLVPLMTERNAFLVSLLRHISQVAQTPDLNSLHVEALALTCLHEARSLGLRNAPRQSSSLPKAGLSSFQTKLLARYIEERLDTDIHLIDLANVVRLSPYHFSRSFTAAFGVSPYHYIVTRRIDRAKEMMLRREASLLEIALLVGFSGSSQFSRAFRKITGTTPSHWRGNTVAVQGIHRAEPHIAERA